MPLPETPFYLRASEQLAGAEPADPAHRFPEPDMSLARAAATLLALFALTACAPRTGMPTELTASETLELLALSDGIKVAVDPGTIGP